MVTRGDRMLKRCGLVKARESENQCVYAGIIDCSGEDVDAVLEIARDIFRAGRYAVIMLDQFAHDEDAYIGLSAREARAVAQKIRELERRTKRKSK